MLNKSWKPSIEDIKNEIERLKVFLTDLPFNSDFSYNVQRVKIRHNELTQRLYSLREAQKAERAMLREMINAMAEEFRQEEIATLKALADLKMIRCERGRQNHLRMLEIRKAREEAQELEKID